MLVAKGESNEGLHQSDPQQTVNQNWIIRNTEGKSSKDAGKVKGRREERRDTHSETQRWEEEDMLAEGRGGQFAFDMGLI